MADFFLCKIDQAQASLITFMDRPQSATARSAVQRTSLLISWLSLSAWLPLMVAVAARRGGPLAMAAITVMPLLAHIVSLSLASRVAAPAVTRR